MVIHKLIAFLGKDIYLIFWILRNPTKYCCEDKQITLLFYIYTIHFSNSFSLFFISATLSSDTFSIFLIVIQFPSRICSKAVANNHQAIKCDRCNLWIHIKCNRINKQTYNYLKLDSSHRFCISCTKQFLPFSGIEDGEFAHASLGKKLSLPIIHHKDWLTYSSRTDWPGELIDLVNYLKWPYSDG